MITLHVALQGTVRNVKSVAVPVALHLALQGTVRNAKGVAVLAAHGSLPHSGDAPPGTRRVGESSAQVHPAVQAQGPNILTSTANIGAPLAVAHSSGIRRFARAPGGPEIQAAARTRVPDRGLARPLLSVTYFPFEPCGCVNKYIQLEAVESSARFMPTPTWPAHVRESQLISSSAGSQRAVCVREDDRGSASRTAGHFGREASAYTLKQSRTFFEGYAAVMNHDNPLTANPIALKG